MGEVLHLGYYDAMIYDTYIDWVAFGSFAVGNGI